MRLLFAQNTEEEAAKFRKGILWITIGIIVMQMAYTFVKLLFDRDVGETLAANLIEKLLNPIFLFLETSASFFFIGGAIFAFYRIISANGDEEKSKGGRMSILYAIIGFIIVKVSRLLVESIYGRLECRNLAGGFIEVTNSKCLTDAAPE
ncbi:MAG: hypothetical protein H6767_06175 [Candidatus Peribacteria bacterium]|nr:MAG: hypothetical protein H6767_06175 [Candidatus Peribacteria bacterium]